MELSNTYLKIKKLVNKGVKKGEVIRGRLPFEPGHDLLFGALLLGVLLVFWVSTIDLPYWWDSVYVTHSAYQFLETNFSSLVPKTGDFAHPPLFMLLLALVWKVFGESLFISHLLILVFTFLALFYTYLLGKEIVKDEAMGRWVGFFSAFLLLVSPVFLAQVGIVYFEIPVTAFCVMAVYYFLRGNGLGYIVSASLMLLTKEVSGVVIGVMLAFILGEKISEYLRKGEVDLEEAVREIMVVFSPFFFLFLWFFYHNLETGWWLVRPGRSLGGSQGFSLSEVPRVFDFVFRRQGRILLTLLIGGLGLGALYRKDYLKYFRDRNVLFILLIPVVVCIFFGVTEFLYRYILFGLPFFFLSGVYFSLKVFERIPGLKELDNVFRATMLGFLVLGLFYLSYASWDKHRKITDWHFSPLEDNLEYQDVIKVGQDVVKYIEDNYADKTVWTSFPANYMLGEPEQHFATKEIEVRNCNEYKKGDRVEMVVFHVFSPVSSDCLTLVRGLNMSLLSPFSRNGKWMQVFQNPHLEQESP